MRDHEFFREFSGSVEYKASDTSQLFDMHTQYDLLRTIPLTSPTHWMHAGRGRVTFSQSDVVGLLRIMDALLDDDVATAVRVRRFLERLAKLCRAVQAELSVWYPTRSNVWTCVAHAAHDPCITCLAPAPAPPEWSLPLGPESPEVRTWETRRYASWAGPALVSSRRTPEVASLLVLRLRDDRRAGSQRAVAMLDAVNRCDRIGALAAALRPAAASPALPARLGQVLRDLLDGHAEKAISARLGISRHTVHVHVKLLYRRFGVSSRAELLSLWLKALLRTNPELELTTLIPTAPVKSLQQRISDDARWPR